MRSFLELAADRYSVRSYSQRAIEPEKIAQVLEAGRIAPTACNRQPQRIKVISTAEDLQKAGQCAANHFGAPAMLLICYDKTVCWKRRFDGASSGVVDASIVTTQIILAARDLGLGTCWIMYFDPAKAVELYALPENIVPVAFVPIGYPAEDAKPADQHSDRFQIEKILL